MPVDLHALYSVPPAEFVVARTALVAALKAEQRREEAAAVQQLRRPRLAEHALNAAARSEPRVVERWVHAVVAADAAQSMAIGGGGAAALRDAAAELRDAHAAMLASAVAALGDNGAAQRDDINDTLRALAHPEGAPLLQHGVVGSEQLGDLALFAGAPDPVVRRGTAAEAPPRRGRGRATVTSVDPGEAPAKPAPKIDLKRLRALERSAASAQADSERADQALGAARVALAAAKEAVAVATTAAAQARADARAADAAVTELRDTAR